MSPLVRVHWCIIVAPCPHAPYEASGSSHPPPPYTQWLSICPGQCIIAQYKILQGRVAASGGRNDRQEKFPPVISSTPRCPVSGLQCNGVGVIDCSCWIWSLIVSFVLGLIVFGGKLNPGQIDRLKRIKSFKLFCWISVCEGEQELEVLETWVELNLTFHW